MLATVRALMEHLIDYAGMFPPARLPLREALHHYRRLSATPEAWMLGRFACPAAQLGELEASPTAPLAIATLVRLDHWQADLAEIERFRTGGGGSIDMVEMALPLPRAISPDEVRRLGVPVFLELPVTPNWQRDLGTLRDSLVSLRPSAGLKVRCGGVVIPTVEQVAQFIAVCRDARLAWKATAGLHHPLRHGEMHGFLNVFMAGLLAQVHGLGPAQLAEVLSEESADAFRFADDRLGWRAWECTVEQIREARRWMPSFGSCSFEEPRDDLRGLGLLP
jgi:hypothetical protein